MKNFHARYNVFAMLALIFVVIPAWAMAADLEIEKHSVVGNQVIFTVNVKHAPNQVSALGLDIGYDPEILQYNGADFSGTFLEGWKFRDVSNPETGILRLGGFTVGNNIAADSNGPLAKIRFLVLRFQECQLPVGALKDGLVGWSTANGAL